MPFARLCRLLPALLLVPALLSQRPVDNDDVLRFLDRNIGWYRDISALVRSPGSSREALFVDGLRQSSTTALRQAFEFAKAEAAIPAASRPDSAAPEDDRSRSLRQRAGTIDQNVEELQNQIEQLDREIGKAPARQRPVLTAKRERLIGALNLTKARRDMLHGLVGFLSSPEDAGLTTKIGDLERTVPETTAESAAARTAAQDFHAESSGIVGLTTQIFTLSSRMSLLDRLIHQTDDVLRANDELRRPLRSAAQEVVKRGDAILQTQDTGDAATLVSQRKELDALLARFKQLSAVSSPLSRQRATLNSSRANLAQWHASSSEENATALRYLLLRLGMLATAIAVIFLFSELWRRGTMRYVQEIRRRRQLLLLRRIVVGCTVTLFIALSFVSEFGSLATFAGFSAAGIALALQSVIVSMVAYFFLVGRWGVKVGDRITVSGVTGEVFDVGLFRLWLMELGGTGPDLHPTGRIVAFPNAVFFQPSALFKQFPGINYTWRTISLTIDPDTDHAVAEKRVRGAVESVYAEYCEAIERQHRAAQASMNLQTPLPRPESRLRLLDTGLEFMVRYPVEIGRVGEIDDRVTRELIAALEREPQLKLASGGTPKVVAAA